MAFKDKIKIFLFKTLAKQRNRYNAIMAYGIKSQLKSCGSNVSIGEHTSITAQNVSVGNRVHLGRSLHILSTRAEVIIGNDVMIGPGVTIITGDHRTDIIGRTMISVRDDEKIPENDQDVVIEDDVWIGANVTILKGVTIGKGSIVAAGAVVTKSIPPYSLAGGVPAKVIKQRFEKDDLQKHIEIINSISEVD